jgi:hypothetical protein
MGNYKEGKTFGVRSCEHCKKDFVVTTPSKKFCNKECYKAGAKIKSFKVLKCNCGVEFIQTITLRKYCSKECNNWADKFYLHGVTKEQYYSMLEKQGGVCAICGADKSRVKDKSKNGKTLMFAIDHCHTTGKIRGLLCSKCNMAIGQLGDTADSVNRAVEYLRRA